jgi:hypothetical protein
MGEAENLIYGEGQAIFKCLGRMKYLIPGGYRPRMAIM